MARPLNRELFLASLSVRLLICLYVKNRGEAQPEHAEQQVGRLHRQGPIPGARQRITRKAGQF